MESANNTFQFRTLKLYNNLFLHRIYNIFNVLRLSLHSISKKVSNFDKIKDLYENIINEVERGIDSTKKFQKIFKFNNYKHEFLELDIISLINEEIKRTLLRFPNHNIEIKLESTKKVLKINTNVLISHIFENLLLNAIYHNESSIKKICIRINEIIIEDKPHICVNFTDNGIGIQNSVRDQLFTEKPIENY